MHMKTKNLFCRVFSVILILGFISCQYEPFSESVDPNTSTSDERVNEALKKLEFDLKKVKYAKDYIIVDGDIVLSRKDLIERLESCEQQNNAKTDQYVLDVGGIVDWNKAGAITYRIDQSILNDPEALGWTSAIRTAASDWTNIGDDNINLTETSGSADITFYSDQASPLSCMNNLDNNTLLQRASPLTVIRVR
jgi:hypothetical protein